MIKAILFDFGQTLVDAADGFRAAEKAAQAKLFANMSLTLHEDFMANYRRIRKNFMIGRTFPEFLYGGRFIFTIA